MKATASGGAYGECTEDFFGIYPGVAEKVIDPEGRGRITVKLPWISDKYETLFAPVAQIYAGDKYGALWLPEQGDQVIVAFIRGQLKKPVVLGSMYSNKRKPATHRSKKEDPKVFRTKGGHYLLMEDQKNKRVELTDLTGKNSIVIDSEKNNITVVAQADVTVKAGKSLTLEAKSDITIKAGGKVNVSGTEINLN